MKNQVRWLFAIVCILGGYTYAQTTLSPDSCSERRLAAENQFDQPELALSLIRDCIEEGDSYSLLLGGKLLLEGEATPAEKRKAYAWTRKAAEAGNVLACTQLGVFYKDGIGTTQDYQKAMEWFVKAYERGDSKGSYSVGYLYMKGLGVTQSYSKAIEWYEKSSYPMAKHFLGMCHFFGYGVPENKAKGLELLKSNPIVNSQTLYRDLITKDKPKGSTGPELIDPLTSTKTTSPGTSTSYQNVTGIYQVEEQAEDTAYHGELIERWEGSLRLYDCSGRKIVQTIPTVQSIFAQTNGSMKLQWKLQGRVVTMPAEKSELGFTFGNNSILPIERKYRESPYEKALDFSLSAMELYLKKMDKEVVGVLKAQIEQWKEPAPLMEFVYQRQTYRGEAAAQTIAKLREQEFIRLYPNPFEDDLSISYELEAEDTVRIDLYNLSGTYHKQVQAEAKTSKGEQSLRIREANLRPGMYIVRITTSKRSYTRQLIKH